MPEYDDCKILAERTGLPIQEIMKEVTSRAIERIRPETDI
jgi:uncharacterized protein (DUF111 family)